MFNTPYLILFLHARTRKVILNVKYRNDKDNGMVLCVKYIAEIYFISSCMCVRDVQRKLRQEQKKYQPESLRMSLFYYIALLLRRLQRSLMYTPNKVDVNFFSSPFALSLRLQKPRLDT